MSAVVHGAYLATPMQYLGCIYTKNNYSLFYLKFNFSRHPVFSYCDKIHRL